MIKLIVEKIKNYNELGLLDGFIEMKTITLYDEDSKKDSEEYYNYNKSDMPFLCFEEFDEEASGAIGHPCLKEVLKIKISEPEARKIKRFILDNKTNKLYNQ